MSTKYENESVLFSSKHIICRIFMNFHENNDIFK